MIKRFLAWLKSIYFKPATADIKTVEVVIMSDIPVDDSQRLNNAPVISTIPDENVQQSTPEAPTVKAEAIKPLSPLEALKARDDEFVNFVVHGLAVLGKDAEAELVALKTKYL